MKEYFGKDLSDAQEKEKTAVEELEALRAAKEDELAFQELEGTQEQVELDITVPANWERSVRGPAPSSRFVCMTGEL